MIEKPSWNLFPFPTLHSGDLLISGSIYDAPQECRHCPLRSCKDAALELGSIGTCRYGMNFVHLDAEASVVGIVVSDAPQQTKVWKRKVKRRDLPNVRKRDLQHAVTSIVEIEKAEMEDLKALREDRIRHLLEVDAPFTGIVSELRADIAKSMNQSHDFLQLLKQIKGHIGAVLSERYPGIPASEAAEKSPEAEGAIFFATELMLGKLDATLFLEEPQRVFGDERDIQLHKLASKYFKIYRHQAAQKNVDIMQLGESRGRVRCNASALGAVIQALLDNCIKYAPSGSKADIIYQETDPEITLRFESLGPKIGPDELQRIFLPGFRAKGAKASEESGLGFGLAAAMQISEMLQLRLKASQSNLADPAHRHHFQTTFTFTIDRSG